MTGRWSHLKLKVLAFGIAMSVLPLAMFGWYSVEAARTAQLEAAAAQNEAGARLVAEEMAQFVTHLQSEMEHLTRLVGPELNRIDRGAQERALYALLRDAPYLEELSLVDGQGREQLRVSRRAVTTGMAPATLKGTPLWRELAGGAAGLGPVTLDEDGRPLVAVGVPLVGEEGALVGQATLRGLMANIAAVRGNSDLRIHVLDNENRLIGDSDFSLVLAGATVPRPGDSGLPYRSVTGDESLGVALPVPGLDWRVVGETTLDSALAPVRRLGLEYAGGATGLMLLVVALSVVFGLQLTEPLERLEAGARRVGEGDLTYRIEGGGRDELGRLITAFNAMTGRLRAQSDALRHERDRLDLVVSSMGAGLALIDPTGQVLWVNRTLADWFPETPVGRLCWESLGRAGCTDCERGCRKVDAGQHGAEQETLLHGRPRLLRYATFTLEGEARPGEPYRLEVVEDVTERRSMEAMVRQSEKLAAVGQLAAGVAHEINNPLAVIQAYAQDLDERLREEGAAALEEQGELSAYLQQLQVQVRRCKGITTNLLDFARRGPTEPEPVDLADVARATAELLGARTRKAGVQIRTDLPKVLPLVRATRDELQQVFLNLLTNALDAMEETGPGTITVTAAAHDGLVEAAVSDTGPGMDAATLERVMEPFFTTKPPGRGTGLGLSTCYGILTGLGGQMHLASQPGAGTTVSFALREWGESHAELVAADCR
jgi:two-component system, NtrC family, sensor kinase